MPYDPDEQYNHQEPPQLQDIKLNCSCGAAFLWTKGEQKFMNVLQMEGKIREVKTPMRCPDCRAKKKLAMNQR